MFAQRGTDWGVSDSVIGSVWVRQGFGMGSGGVPSEQHYPSVILALRSSMCKKGVFFCTRAPHLFLEMYTVHFFGAAVSLHGYHRL